jgi:hypothetical protein
MVRVAIKALECTGKLQDIAGSKAVDSVIRLSETAFFSILQGEFDEEPAASKLIPGRIGLAIQRIHNPG